MDITIGELEAKKKILQSEQMIMEIMEKEIQQEIDKIKKTKLEPMVKQIYQIKGKLEQVERSLKEKKEMEEEKQREIECKDIKIPFDITDKMLDALPLSKIHQLVKLLFDVDELDFYTSGTEHHQKLILSPLAYRSKVIDRIRFEISDRNQRFIRFEHCRYCHRFLHTISSCPIIKKMKCSICQESGHTEKKCTMTVTKWFTAQKKSQPIESKIDF
jgi:hypothetical protein